MKLFLDSAIVKDILPRVKSGLISGVTTNPTLIKKSGRDPIDVYRELSHDVSDISMEVVAQDVPQFIEESLKLSDYFGDIATIKVPCTDIGLKTCKYLANRGIRVNVTLVFSSSQAILAALAGATYVSPFVGRMDDNSLDGLGLIADISNIFQKHKVDTQILAASIRDTQSVARAFGLGANICTIPVKVFDGMSQHVLTDKGLDQFDHDYMASVKK